MKKNLLLLSFLVMNATVLFSQTVQERKKITESYDRAQIEKLHERLKSQKLENTNRLKTAVSANPSITIKTNEEGEVLVLRRVLRDGTPLYYTNYNNGSSRTLRADRLYSGNTLNLNVNGENMVAGVWEGGTPFINHQEFQDENGQPKITLVDDTLVINDHSTHVTGTIIASGVNPKARGIAPKAKVIHYDLYDDYIKMADFAEEGYLVSNHSYGYNISMIDPPPVWLFGAYEWETAVRDDIAYAFPKYQIVKAAGNVRKEWPFLNESKNGYELMADFSSSKNILTIGSVEELFVYREPHNILITRYSHFGPVDDGRIKPNLVAKGNFVYSAFGEYEVEDDYGLANGTSMATPAITGAILLLQQHYNNLYEEYMNSSSVRGLLQHTTMEAGYYPGPDYRYGWGLPNIEVAAQLISDSKDGNAVLEENTLQNGQSYTKIVTVDGTKPLIVSISWTDPMGPINEDDMAIVDWDQKALVNDLDVRVTDEAGVTYYPWKLDAKNYTAPATKGDNEVDNFERIDIPEASGTYTVTVTHKGTLVEEYGSEDAYHQDYTLIVSNNSGGGISIEENNAEQILKSKVYPNPADDIVTVVVNDYTNYTLYKVSGEIIMNGKFIQGENTLDISKFNTGIYILKLENSQNVETMKIMKR